MPGNPTSYTDNEDVFRLMRYEVKRGVVPTWMLRPYDWTVAISEQFIQELRERIHLTLVLGGLVQRC